MKPKKGIQHLIFAVVAFATVSETLSKDLADGKIGFLEMPGLIKAGMDLIPVAKNASETLAELKDLDPGEVTELVHALDPHLPSFNEPARRELVERIKRALPLIVGAVQELIGNGLPSEQGEPVDETPPQTETPPPPPSDSTPPADAPPQETPPTGEGAAS